MIERIINLIKYRTEAIYLKPSFSTNGEDILINSILKNIRNGFYVDVGAHHPFRFSNTYLLYKRGWRGINIDANTDSIELIKRYRKKDTNIVAAISEDEGEYTYYSNEFGALNTLDISKFNENPHKFENQKKVKTIPLKEILNKHLSENQKIDFLNIDIEGFDFQALKSFSWETHKPNLVCVEDLKFNLEIPNKSDIYCFMKEKGYIYYAFIPNTLFFILK